jgi:hypothetical protein
MASSGVTDKKFISAIAMMDQREIFEKVIQVQNDPGLLDVLNLTSRKKPTKQPVYHHFVDESVYILGDTTGATVTGSGTATVVTTLTAATSGYARKNDLVKFPNGKVGLISDKSTASSQDSLTIKSVDGTNLTHTAGQKLSFFSNAFGEMSKAPVNRKTGFTKYSNKTQIFREINVETDVQSVSTIEVEFQGQNYIAVKNNFEKAAKIRSDINAAMIGGSMSATSFEDASPALTDPTNGGAVQTTRGLDDYVTSYGITDAVASAGTWTLADQGDLIDQFIAVKAPKNYMGFYSSKAKRKIDDHLKNLGSGGVTSGRLNVDGESLSLKTDSFEYGGFKFQFTCLPILDHPEIFSQTDISKSIYYVPEGQVPVQGGGTAPYMQIRYSNVPIRGKNLGSELISEWYDGALAPTGPVGEEAVWKTHWYSMQGLEVLGAQHMARQKVLA